MPSTHKAWAGQGSSLYSKASQEVSSLFYHEDRILFSATKMVGLLLKNMQQQEEQ
jgi:hypothetical protein